jgi:SAM-dependent methyltransferase
MSSTYQEITDHQQRIWASGDFHRVGMRLVPISERLAASLDIRPGERVLDVAGGTGNTALAAARRDAHVICTDFVPELLEHATRRSEVELLPFRTMVADAQALPFADADFDVVTSTLGVMFAPNQDRAAAELARVTRRGGRIGLVAWTPGSAGAELLALIARYVPPPAGLRSPARWGTPEGLAELLGPWISEQRLSVAAVDVTAPSLDEQFSRFRLWFGPFAAALSRLDEVTQAAFVQEWRELWQRFNRADDGTVVVPHEYLEIIAIRA